MPDMKSPTKLYDKSEMGRRDPGIRGENGNGLPKREVRESLGKIGGGKKERKSFFCRAKSGIHPRERDEGKGKANLSLKHYQINF